MNGNEMDKERRQFLTKATTLIGGIGAACVSIPFISSWAPSAKTKAMGAPVQLDISKLEPGQKITVAWRGQPVFVVNRTAQALKDIQALTDHLRDPDSSLSVQPKYIKGPYRSIKENILIIVGICTHLGCVPVYKPEAGSVESAWLSGFFCPCHGSKYDMAGRVYKGVPAPLNLPIPPHRYVNDTVVLIGEDTQGVS